jgi:hypothetical protein
VRARGVAQVRGSGRGRPATASHKHVFQAKLQTTNKYETNMITIYITSFVTNFTTQQNTLQHYKDQYYHHDEKFVLPFFHQTYNQIPVFIPEQKVLVFSSIDMFQQKLPFFIKYKKGNII